MLIDPENYLSKVSISKIFNKMKNIYKDYKINTYIILINTLDFDRKYGDINDEVKKFTSYFNYLLHKGNSMYNDSMALTTVFFIKERKMRMRTGKELRKIISDENALEILNNSLDNTFLNFYALDTEISENLRKDINVELFKRTICDIYMNSDLNKRYIQKSRSNKKLIQKILKENTEKRTIYILNKTFQDILNYIRDKDREYFLGNIMIIKYHLF